MPRVTQDYIPGCVKHSSGQAVVRLNGRDYYLGKWKSVEAKSGYERLIAQWLIGGRRLPEKGNLVVNELILAYWQAVGK